MSERLGSARCERGYAMAALLVGLSVMAVLLSVALPVWGTMAKREREEELIFRGQQYARAIGLFQRKYANASPPSLDILLNEKFLRKKYKDPMTKDGEFQLLSLGAPPPGGAPQRGGGLPSGAGVQAGRGVQGGAPQAPGGIAGAPVAGAGGRAGITGVASKSTETSIRLFNGRNKYNEWAFVATAATVQAGGAANPAQGGRAGQPGRGEGPGRGGPQDPTGGRSPFTMPPAGGREPGGAVPGGAAPIPGRGFRPGV